MYYKVIKLESLHPKILRYNWFRSVMLFNSTVIGSNYFQGGGGGEIAGYKGLSQLAPSTFGDRRHRGIIVESSKSASPLLRTAKRDGGDYRDARFRHL